MERPKWGDQDDLEEFDRDLSHEVQEEPLPDGSILRTVVEYTTNSKGQKVKLIRKIRVFKKKVKINKKVLERRQWDKFGECAHSQGAERGVTSIGDEVFVDLSTNREFEKEKQTNTPVANLGIVCRNCGKTGDHWTLKCPYLTKDTAPGTLAGGAAKPAGDAREDGSRTGKYIPPALSGRGTSTDHSDMARNARRDETATIRVTNLSEDTKESDLSELFRTFGPISRIYLAKDRNSGLSKGFAFINFVHRDDAGKAIQKLSGFGYDHLILHVEWAKPSNK